MDAENQKLTKQIMKRVYGIWFLRQLGPTLVLMPVLAIITLWQTASEFFVAKIVENFIISLHSGNIFPFIASAFANAPVMPLLVIGFSTGLFLILAYRLVRNFIQLTLVRI